MNYGTILFLFGTVFGSFFSGMGETKTVMFANVTGMLVNIPLAYFFVFNSYGWNPLSGCALATCISQLCALSVYVVAWMRRKESRFRTAWAFDALIMRKLFKYGFPTGVEFFLSFFTFSTFGNFFHSYGMTEAVAMTIAINWDIFAFMSLWGLSHAVMSLVGQYMGARRVDLALKTTYSGAKIAACIAFVFISFFCLLPEVLISVFLQGKETDPELAKNVLELGPSMMRFMSLYTLGLASNLVFCAALRAAGDTRVCMWMQNLTDCSMLFWTSLAIKHWHLPSLWSWCIFVGHIICLGLFAFLRFKHGKWQLLRVVLLEPAAPFPNLPAMRRFPTSLPKQHAPVHSNDSNPNSAPQA